LFRKKQRCPKAIFWRSKMLRKGKKQVLQVSKQIK